MANKKSKAAAQSPAASTSKQAAAPPSSPPTKKTKQAEDAVTKQTTRYQETPSVATSTAAPLTAPSEATEGPSFGDLLGETPSTLAPIPSTSSSSSRPTPLSLSRLLTQALHSSDTPLLNSCLSHSDPTLVGQTVRRLQPELTVPLIERLAERMALGGRGRQGGASAQRVRGVCIWLKVTLREKLSYLSTIPNLLARLEPLHRLINERLALTGPLMALAGRLDLALAQMELRDAEKEEESAREGGRYVEGESSDEDDSEDEEEVALEEGDIEDVGLGGDSDEDDEDASDVDDEDSEEDDESGEELGGPNRFIDDEASEEGSEAGDEDDLSDSE